MGPSRRQPRATWRVLLALLLIVAGAAATTVVFVRGQFDQLAHALGTNKSVHLASGTLAPSGFGQPETLLLIGNDQRKHTTTSPVLPHANEMLLVRIDPSKPWISMMSVPRELEVNFNPTCDTLTVTRLNAALMCGGINRVVQMVKQVTGLSINHVVEIDFGNFVKAVNEMGCVYGTIDRRYFHVNVPGGPQYFQVNLQPGYQKLCGEQALQFVTYRHGDTALVRDARDQTFLEEVKQEFAPTLIDNIGKFENIFGHLVQTDPGLQTSDGVEKLLGTLISVAGDPVRQVRFQVNPVEVSAPCTCLTSTPGMIAASVHSFLSGRGLPPARRSTAALAKRVQHRRTAGVISVPADQLAPGRALARRLPLPMELPDIEVNTGYGSPVAYRSYRLPAPGGHRYPTYVAVFATGLLGQYYDVQGSTWETAPLFDNPESSITVAGRHYYLYYTGQHITQVVWFTARGAYWVRNTLTYGLSNAQILALAEHTAPVIGAAAGSVHRDVRQQVAAPSTVTVISTASSPLHTVGEVGGVLALLTLLVGIVLLWQRHRRVRELSAGAGVAAGRLAALEGQLARITGAPTPQGLLAEAEPAPRRLQGLAVAAAISVLLSGGGVAAVAAITAGGAAARPRAKHRALPRAPIVVLNAGTQAGAAARLARRLRREHQDVLGAANLNSVAPVGYEVLYVGRSKAQALTVSRLLVSNHPLVAPADPDAVAAAGQRARVVVVIP